MTITFDELQQEFYEDLNGLIHSVRNDGGTFKIDMSCDHWRDDVKVTLTIECYEVVECTIAPSATGIIYFVEEHPLLWYHNQEHIDLYFSSAPNNPYDLCGRIYELQTNVFRTQCPPQYSVAPPIAFLSAGRGRLASGPLSWIEKLREVVEPYIQCTTLKSYKPTGGYKLLEFDEGYVICRAVKLVETKNNSISCAD